MTQRRDIQNRRFFRWLKTGPKIQEGPIENATEKFLSVLEPFEFKWVEKNFDGGCAQAHAIELERENAQDVDFISIIFDKDRSWRFKVISGKKECFPPHKWIQAGDLVRYQSDLDRAKWWGASWWNLNKRKSFERSVNKVVELLPELEDFLSNGTVGNAIYKWPKG